eukprot:gene8605-9533_t
MSVGSHHHSWVRGERAAGTAAMRWIIEKAREINTPVNFCFINYAKAFDCVQHHKLWEILRNFGVPNHLNELIKSMYRLQMSTNCMEHGDSERFEILKGGAKLYNLYAKDMMRETLNDIEWGFNIGRQTINNLRYADDTTFVATAPEDLQTMIAGVRIASEEKGLFLNVAKTKVISKKMARTLTL